MSKFVCSVQVPHRDGHHVGFVAGDKVPDWAVDVVGDHVHDGDTDTAVGSPETAADPAEDANQSDGDTDTAVAAPDFTKPAPAKRGRPRKQA